MFSIETTDDIKLLKELTSLSKNDEVYELKNEIKRLSNQNAELIETTKRQDKLIEEIVGNLVTADQCKNIVLDLMTNSTKPDVIAKKGRVVKIKHDTDVFDIIPSMKSKYNKILVEGNTLIHHTVKNQKMKLPISTIELLALVEVYQYRKRKILIKDAKNFCKLYSLSKMQFGKIYHNLREGVFFKALEAIDSQIKGTHFKVINGFINIIDGGTHINTQISVKKYKELLNIYVNSDQPYSTIYKLSLEYSNINPVHLLTVLKRNAMVSKVINNG